MNALYAEPVSPDEVSYSRGWEPYDNVPEQRTAATFEEFRELVLADQSARKGLAFVCGPMGPAPDDAAHRDVRQRGTGPTVVGMPYRSARTAAPSRFIGLDLDKCTAEIFGNLCVWMGAWSAFGYTTASHTPDKPRARFIVETDRPMTRPERLAVAEAFRARAYAKTQAVFDKSLDVPEQPIYTPVTGAHEFRYEGGALCVDQMLEAPAASLNPVPAPASEGTHPCVVKDTQMLAEAVRRGHMTQAEAVRLVESRTYERPLPRGEVARALEGAMRKSTTQPDLPPAEVEAMVAVSLVGFMRHKSNPAQFIFNPLFPRRHVTLLAGHGGSGKSTLALIASAHYAAGRDWADLVATGPGCALYVSLEDEASIVIDRLQRIVRTYRLDWELVEANLRILDGTAGDAALMTEVTAGGSSKLVETSNMAQVEQAAAGAALIVVDNASDGYDGNESARRQVRTFVRRLAQVARANNAALVLLAHIDKDAAKHGSNGNSYSGSTAWHNSARSRLALVESDGVTELRQEKLNLGPKAAPIALQFNDEGVMVPGRLDPESAQAAASLVAAEDAKRILEVMEVACNAGVRIPTATSGPSTAAHALGALPEMPKVYRSKGGRERLFAALVSLSRSGQIVRTEFKSSGRHVRECWELAQKDRRAA